MRGPYISGMLTNSLTLFFRALKNSHSFGHEVLTACSYCQSFNDYALYALPPSLLEYIREIGFIGVRPFILHISTVPLFAYICFRPLHFQRLPKHTSVLSALAR